MKQKKTWLISITIFIFTLVLYIPRISPSVFSADSGDLLSAIISNGVAHPPGYPLFILLGRFFNFLPIAGTVAYGVGFLSAISTSLTVVLLFIISYLLTKRYLPSIITSVSYALIYTVWTYAEVVETFSLANLLSTIIILIALLVYRDLEKQKRNYKLWYLLFFFIGLSLTNHHSIVLLIIPLVYLFYPYRKLFLTVKNNLLMLFFFILGFSIYTSVYFAALKIPFVNWDYPHNLQNFLHLFTRADYGSYTMKANWVNENPVIRLFQMWPYIYMLYMDWSFLGLGLIVLGLITAKRYFERFYFFLILSVIFYGPLFMLYGGPQLSSLFSMGIYERFILLNNPFFTPFMAMGIISFTMFIAEKLKANFEKKKLRTFILLVQTVFLLIPFSLYVRNHKRTDYSKFTLGDELGRIIFKSANDRRKAILFVSGDDDIFTTWYHVLSKYKTPPSNIAIIPSDLLGMKGMDKMIKKYYSWTYFPELATKKYGNELFGLYILKFIDKVPLYTSEEISIPRGFKLYPRGAVFRIVRENSKIEINKEIDFYKSFNKEITPEKYLEMPLTENFFVRDFILNYGNLHGYYARFFVENKKYVEAKGAIKEALKYNPQFYEMHLLLGIVNREEKKCEEAEKNLIIYKEINPNLQVAYSQLQKNARECFKDKKKEEKYKKQWEEIVSKSKKSLKEL